MITVLGNDGIGIGRSQYRSMFLKEVQIIYISDTGSIKFTNRGAEVTRNRFPLVLAWTTTIHKVQGLTLNDVLYSGFARRMSHLVGLNLLLNTLDFINFQSSAITKSIKLQEEMIRLRNILTCIATSSLSDIV